jgi:fatty acid desaturase
MDEPIERTIQLAPGELKALCERRDAQSLRHAAGSLGLLAASLLALFLPASPVPQPLAVLAAGLMTGAMFPPFHESLHRSVFRSRVANDVLAAITGFFQVASPTGYRAFHHHHHRHTHSPDDPEISGAPDLLAYWPSNPGLGLIAVSGQLILIGKLGMLLGQPFLPNAMYARAAPWLPERDRARVRVEAAVILTLHGLILTACARAGAAWVWPTLFVIGHAGMGPFLACEHTGLPMEGPVLARTRSLRTHPVIAWFAWNMNLHAEHHGWPAVPWWQLPALSRTLGDRVPHRMGYRDALADGVAHWFRRA